jgi:hypothetical protein
MGDTLMKKFHVRCKEVKEDSNLLPILDKLDRVNTFNIKHKKEDRGKKERDDFKKKYPSA